jgi:hypothetical protein
MMVVQSMADMFECSNNLAPLGSARGALGSARGALWSAQTVRRAKPRREIQCIYTNPSALIGVQHSAPLGVQHSASLGVQCSGLLGVQCSGLLGVQPLGSARGATPRLRSGCNLKEISLVLGNVVFTPISLHILPHVCI